MSNRFLTFLEKIGHDFKVGLDTILPFAQAASVTIVPALDPAIGPLFATTVGVVSQTEQKFAAMGQQSGTGVQKLAEATSILQPVVAQAFAAAGKPSDNTTVQNYINAVVAFLNAVPATASPAPSAPTVQTPAVPHA